MPQQLRSARAMVNYGNGDVRDEPDPLHEAAAAEIEQLRAENAAKDELIARARASAKLWAGHYEWADERERALRARVDATDTPRAEAQA